MAIGDNIKKARKEAGLTQKQLSEKIHKGFSTVQKYELGLFTPPISVIKDIAIAVNVSINELLDTGDFWWQQKSSQIEETDRKLSETLEKLLPDERVYLSNAFATTLEYLTRIDGDELRKCTGDKLKIIISAIGEILFKSCNLWMASNERPDDYLLLLREYERVLKNLEELKKIIIDDILEKNKEIDNKENTDYYNKFYSLIYGDDV